MVGLYSWSPYLFAYISFMFQTLIVLSYVWFPKGYEIPKKGIKGTFLRFFKHFFSALYFIFGAIMLHSALFWIFGQWTYADWKFQLPSVLLGLILCSQYILVTLFVKPTKLDVVYGTISFLYGIIMSTWFMPSFPNMKDSVILFITGMIILVIIFPFLKEFEYQKSGKNLNYIWDWSSSLYKIFNRPFNLIFWVIAIIEAICKFEGVSIFLLF